MTTDSFSAHLDAHPDDWAHRLVYADWLEEQGRDAEAECQRWMVREGVHWCPYRWSWWSEEYFPDVPHPGRLPLRVFNCIDAGGPTIYISERGEFVCYRTRHDAEADLCLALVACGEICVVLCDGSNAVENRVEKRSMDHLPHSGDYYE